MYIDIYLYSMPYLTKNTFNLKHGSLLCDLPIETTKYYLISTTMGLVKTRSCQTHPSKLPLAVRIWMVHNTNIVKVEIH